MANFDELMGRMKSMREADAQPVEPEAPVEPTQEAPVESEPQLELEQPEAPPDDISVEDEEPFRVSTLEDVSKALNVPIDELYKVSVPMSVDGQRIEVPIGEWKDNYQTSQRLSTQAEELSRANQEIEAKSAQWGALLEKADAAARVWDQVLEAEENAVDWKTLREDDPTEYVAKRQEFQDRRAKLKQHVDDLQAQRAEAMAEYQKQLQQKQQQFFEEERRLLLRAIPSWKDESAAAKERKEISSFLKDVGFTDAEIGGVSDHRAIVIAREAMLYRQAKARAKATKKETKSVVPPVRPSGRSQRKSADQERADNARKRLRQTGKLRDAAELYRATRGPRNR